MSRSPLLDASTLVSTAGILALSLLAFFFAKLFVRRRRFLRLRRHGLPMPPYNPVLGHLPVVVKVMSKIPKDSFQQYLPGLLRQTYPELGPNFYMDTWPIGPPVLFISDPDTLHQITQEHSLPKHPDLRELLRPISDGLDILTMEGQTWKTWRNNFNPGFTLAHLMTLTPVIVKETLILCDVLRSFDRGREVFQMKRLTDRWTMDIIGKVVLDTQLNTQKSENTMVNALKSQIRWLVFSGQLNPWERWHPFRPLVHWYNTRKMNHYLYPELDRQIAMSRAQNPAATKSIVRLALQTYLAQDDSPKDVDETFKTLAISQIKQFLFSGHDTTSSTVCYMFYLLSTHPAVLDRVRDEHNRKLGPSLDQKLQKLKDEPYVLNQLPFSLAVIKESMRLFPVASTLRGGEPGFHVHDGQGRMFPTEGFLVWGISQPLHRDKTYWDRPEVFLPDRWLVGPENPRYPVKGAWRPFEFGPRNCIGQELALIDMKIAMILVMSMFDIEIAYAEIDRQKPRSPNNVNGERAYQSTSAAPSEGLPCRIKVRETKVEVVK